MTSYGTCPEGNPLVQHNGTAVFFFSHAIVDKQADLCVGFEKSCGSNEFSNVEIDLDLSPKKRQYKYLCLHIGK